MNAGLPQNNHKNNAFYLLSALFSLFAFVVRPGEFIPALAGAKILPISMALTCIGFLSVGGLQKIREKADLGLYPVILLLLLGFFSILFSVWPGNSFEIWWSILLINTLLLLFWLPAVMELKGIRYIVILVAVAAGCLSLAVQLVDPAALGSQRIWIEGSTYDPNDIALVLATFFPVVVFLFLSASFKGRLLFGLVLLSLVVAVIKTGSRGGVLCVAVAGLLLLLQPTRLGVPKWCKIGLLILTLALFMSPVAETVKTRWQTLLSGEDYNLNQTGEGGTGRLDKWRSGAALFLENPITGVGIGNSGTALGMATKNWLTIHNSYLQIGMELGVAGLLLFLAVLLAIWRNCTQAIRFLENSKNSNPLILLAAMTRIALVTFMVGASFLSQAYSILIPILLTLSIGIYHGASSEKYGGEGA